MNFINLYSSWSFGKVLLTWNINMSSPLTTRIFEISFGSLHIFLTQLNFLLKTKRSIQCSNGFDKPHQKVGRKHFILAFDSTKSDSSMYKSHFLASLLLRGQHLDKIWFRTYTVNDVCYFGEGKVEIKKHSLVLFSYQLWTICLKYFQQLGKGLLIKIKTDAGSLRSPRYQTHEHDLHTKSPVYVIHQAWNCRFFKTLQSNSGHYFIPS